MKKDRLKLLVIVGIGCLILTLVASPLAGCAPSAAPKAEKMQITVMTGRPGDPWTVLTYAMASFIREDSERLTATVLPTGGLGDPAKILAEDPSKRSNSTGTGTLTNSTVYLRDLGMYPLFFSLFATCTYGWISYDPNIKTLEDFAGKTVAGPRAHPGWWDYWRVPLEAAGVLDKINISHGGLGGATTALIDGTADIAWTVLDYAYPDKFAASAQMQQAAVKGPVYVIDWGPDFPRVCAQELGWPPSRAMKIPAGTLGDTQPNTIYTFGDPSWWGALVELDEDIVYEITKIIYEHAAKKDFAGFHSWGEGIVPETVPYGPWGTAEDIAKWYHPGALKFYREIGVPGL